MSQHAFGVFVAGDEIRGVGIPGDQNELVQRPVLVEERVSALRTISCAGAYLMMREMSAGTEVGSLAVRDSPF
jgi:hypothetical protein